MYVVAEARVVAEGDAVVEAVPVAGKVHAGATIPVLATFLAVVKAIAPAAADGFDAAAAGSDVVVPTLVAAIPPAPFPDAPSLAVSEHLEGSPLLSPAMF